MSSLGPCQQLRVIVLGYVVGFPLGGMSWHTLQYPMGLRRLGHDVWVLEDSGDWPSAYDPRTYEIGDPTYGLSYATHVYERLGLGARWAYHDAPSGTWYGPAVGAILERCRDADVVLNLAGIHPVRPWLEDIPVRVLVDADPAFTQVRHLTDEQHRARAHAHTHFLTFGELIGEPGCSVPDDGLDWSPTRQPVVLDTWPTSDPPPTGALTTVMQWDSYDPVELDGRRFGMKSDSFTLYRELPARTTVPLHLALGRAPDEVEAGLAAQGWTITDPREASWDPWVYQRFIQRSLGEFSVAKQAYVATRSGWFSERTACYLASGRPAVVEDTGFSRFLPTGEGLFAFSSPDEALDAIEEVRRDPIGHGHAARAIAEEHFGAERVLSALLDRVHGT